MTTSLETIASLELEKAKRSINQFLYSCSHSLRSPLTSAKGITNLLRMNCEQSGSREIINLLSILEDAIGKMDATVMQMQEFLLNSSQKIQIKPVVMSELIEEAWLSLNAHQNWRKVNFEVSVGEQNPMYTDIGRVRITLRHLLLNAISFIDNSQSENDIKVWIDVNDLRARLLIQDNGIGINSEALPNIFNLFFRGTIVSQGAGIGLHLVKEIVEAMGGDVVVSSVEHEGTTFTVTLPNMR